MARPWMVYCLATVDQPMLTYIGATFEIDRRLAQHNRILSGGAKATKARAGEWYRVCFVRGFPDSGRALSFEWHWKHFTKGLPRGLHKMTPLERRQKALDRCLAWAEQTGLTGLEVVFE